MFLFLVFKMRRKIHRSFHLKTYHYPNGIREGVQVSKRVIRFCLPCGFILLASASMSLKDVILKVSIAQWFSTWGHDGQRGLEQFWMVREQRVYVHSYSYYICLLEF